MSTAVSRTLRSGTPGAGRRRSNGRLRHRPEVGSMDRPPILQTHMYVTIIIIIIIIITMLYYYPIVALLFASAARDITRYILAGCRAAGRTRGQPSDSEGGQPRAARVINMLYTT